MYNILLVEDDHTIREGISEFLKENRYTVYEAESAEQGLELFQKQGIHLIILDIMLPGMSGIDMLKNVRADSQIPVIVLTALTDEQTQVKLFDEYADDYLTKPFSLMILQKRVEAQLRHFYGNKQYFEYGDAVVDLKGYIAYYQEQEVNLTTKEFQLLECLIENRGITLTRDQILNCIWTMNEEPYERVIDVYIKNIRQKLHLDCIKTVKGIGYKLEII